MRKEYSSSCSTDKENSPTFAVTTQTVFEGYEGLLIANERFNAKSSGDGGFKNEVLKFKGMDLSYDNDCPSGSMYLLNPMFLKLVYKTGKWMKGRAPVTPANQTVDVFVVRTNCNLIATQPRRLGVITSIT